jgi:hypothetical protein
VLDEYKWLTLRIDFGAVERVAGDNFDIRREVGFEGGYLGGFAGGLTAYDGTDLRCCSTSVKCRVNAK